MGHVRLIGLSQTSACDKDLWQWITSLCSYTQTSHLHNSHLTHTCTQSIRYRLTTNSVDHAAIFAIIFRHCLTLPLGSVSTKALLLPSTYPTILDTVMAHHQQSGYDRVHAAQLLSCSSGLQTAGDKPSGSDDEPADVDEPPDNRIKFARIPMPSRPDSISDKGAPPSPHFLRTRNASLLTQALLSSSDHTSGSEAEAPILTSDGGLTSPNTPSPPLPASGTLGFEPLAPKDLSLANTEADIAVPQASTAQTIPQAPQETSLEAGLKQRRCIKFACGRQSAPQAKAEDSAQSRIDSEDNVKPADPPKRPCMLRFACSFKAPVKAVCGEPSGTGLLSPAPKSSLAIPAPDPRHHRDSGSTVSTIRESFRDRTIVSNEGKAPADPAPKRQKLEKSEATRFHAFGGSFGVEDEWTKEDIKDQQKITVNDTLRKENAIRKLGQEAEEEAIEEDEEEENDDDVEADTGIEELDSVEDVTDGNETDNEEGFADSDDDSDMNSDYQFWTPGLTTAATSTDHIEHIRPLTKRVASDSSIESMINIRERRSNHGTCARRISRSRPIQKAERLRPGTPDLPDSTDFVCGTLDEDRPLEAAYVSCLEQRKRSKHRTIPQDIDPSFPTSDPEMEEEDDEEEGEDAIVRSSDDSDAWIAGRPDNSDGEELPRRKQPLSRRAGKSPMPSPKRMRSPPPSGKRATVHRSSPPRRLFGQSPTSKVAPLRLYHELKSPLSTRMTSPCASPKRGTVNVALARLAQRPHLTHTASLPRTPNPFWSKHRKYLDDLDNPSTGTSPHGHEVHSRGPIDIVKGLENKRQRRREKFWRQHCRTAGKEKERRCQPGKGAERMKEVGLEMAEKCRGYGTKAKVVLSV